MRTAIIFLLLAAAAAACDDQPQPTSPVGRRSAIQPTADVGVSGQGIKLPDAKPTDQVGFTKVQMYSGAVVSIAAGASGTSTASCPAGSIPTGGGYTLGTTGEAPSPSVWRSRPDPMFNSTGWVVSASNKATGADVANVQAWVACAS